MRNINIRKLYKRKYIGNIIILISSALLVYLLISIYFLNHFFFNTVINGADVSLKAHDDVEDIIINYINNYRLQLKERSGEVEDITGQDIGMQYNKKNSISNIYRRKNSLKWAISLFKNQKYYIDDLYVYSKDN